MEPRPYKRLKSDELASLARRESRNMIVLSQIKEEMRHRGTHPAADDVRDLVARLLQVGERTPPPPSRRRTQAPGRPSQQPRGGSGAASTATSGPVPPHAASTPSRQPDYEARYQALRETFTEESELLARWGMTSAMPVAMRRDVFAAWREVLARDQHPYGFTLADLEGDFKKLEAEHGYTVEDEADER